MIDFSNVKHFKRYMFDDPRICQVCSGWNINPDIVYMLDDLYNKTNWVIVPHWSVYGCVVMDDAIRSVRFCKNKWHLRENGCKAVDFHFETEAHPLEQIDEVLKYDFTGIGLFTEIALSTGKEKLIRYLQIAFHVDLGEKERIIWSYPENSINIDSLLNNTKGRM
jgi:hypothetical protein